MSEVLVLVEQADGQLNKVTSELITMARIVGEPSAVIVDAPGVTDSLMVQLKEAGAHKVYSAESEDAINYLIVPQVDVLSGIAEEIGASAIIIAATTTGKEIAGRCAVRTGSGIVGSITELQNDGSAIKPIFAGAFTIKATATGNTPVYTVIPGSIEAQPREGAAQRIDIEFPQQEDNGTRIISREPIIRGDRPSLTDAPIIISGGRGIGSAEGFSSIIEPLADVLDAAVGTTRAAADSGYYSGQFQIGQTGVVVAPEVYLAVGISGAIQHRAGMQSSKIIIAVNNDEDAPIFEIADFGVVGDYAEVIPQLTERVSQHKQS